MPNETQRYEYAPEDYDVVCEVCGTKWDFIEDKFQCPVCGDTLNKVEIATLKEEAYVRRRKKELLEKENDTKKKNRHGPKREKKLMKWISFIAVFGGIIYCVYKFYPEQFMQVVNFLKNFFN